MTYKYRDRYSDEGWPQRDRTGARASTFRCIVLVLMVMLVACTPQSQSKAALPPAPPLVTVTMEEYGYEYSSAIPSGRVVFRFFNAGHVEHRPVLVPLPDDLPPIKEQMRGDDRAVVQPFAGVPPQGPGETGTFAVDLVPDQRYAIICFARDADGRSHAIEGMVAEFRTPEATAPAGGPSTS